jgi:hypothetical protein
VGVDRLLVGLKNAGFEHVVIWSANGRVVYSDRREEVGRQPGTLERLSVDRTRLTSRLERSEARGPSGDLFHVFVPLRFEQSASAGGTLQLSIPYGPIRDGISHTTGLINLFLVVGLGLSRDAVPDRVQHVAPTARAGAREPAPGAATAHRPAQPRALPGACRAGDPPGPARRQRHDRAAHGPAIASEVNDTLGTSGDIVLEELAGRLRGVLRDTDTLARLGGDEFASSCRTPGGPFSSCSSGSQTPRGAVHGGRLPCRSRRASASLLSRPRLRRERAAQRRHHDVRGEAGAQPYAVSALSRTSASSDRVALIAELRHAISAGELDVLYQPKVDLRDEARAASRRSCAGAIRDGACSDRWSSSPRTTYPGLIDPLTQYVLRRALAQARRWHDQGLGCRSPSTSPRER